MEINHTFKIIHSIINLVIKEMRIPVKKWEQENHDRLIFLAKEGEIKISYHTNMLLNYHLLIELCVQQNCFQFWCLYQIYFA